MILLNITKLNHLIFR